MEEEWRFWRTARGSSTESMVDLVFPCRSLEVKAELARLLRGGGVQSGKDLEKKHAGLVHEEMGVPEWACQALVDKELLPPGSPKEVDRDGLHVLQLNLRCEGKKIIRDFSRVRVSKQMLQDMNRQLRGTTRIELATSEITDEEASEFSTERKQAMLGYRALLRFIARQAPVQTHLVDDQAFIGSFYFMTGSGGGSSSSSSSLVDWSKVVWMLQVEGGGVEYGEAVGRIVQGMRQVFIHQPRRQFGFAVLCALREVHTFKFLAGGYKSGPKGEIIHTRLAPQYVGKEPMSLHRERGGFFSIVQTFCAPDSVHGFVDIVEEVEEVEM